MIRPNIRNLLQLSNELYSPQEIYRLRDWFAGARKLLVTKREFPDTSGSFTIATGSRFMGCGAVFL